MSDRAYTHNNNKIHTQKRPSLTDQGPHLGLVDPQRQATPPPSATTTQSRQRQQQQQQQQSEGHPVPALHPAPCPAPLPRPLPRPLTRPLTRACPFTPTTRPVSAALLQPWTAAGEAAHSTGGEADDGTGRRGVGFGGGGGGGGGDGGDGGGGWG